VILIPGAFLIAYLLGAIPSSVWVGKLFFKTDVRQHGSGNPGATNAFRVLGKKAGIIVMITDIAKGFLASSLALFLFNSGLISADSKTLYKILLGITAVFGHLIPVFLNFKGGKGVATLLGMVISLQPEVAGLCIAIFLTVVLITKYVSLGSILGAMCFPVFLLIIPRYHVVGSIGVWFGFLLFTLILITHHTNIKRLVKGVENKTRLFK